MTTIHVTASRDYDVLVQPTRWEVSVQQPIQ